MAARVGLKPATLRTQGTVLTTETLRPTHSPGSDSLTSDEYSLKFFEVCVCLKFLLCNIWPGLICSWNDVYEISAKTFLEGVFMCTPIFLCALISQLVYVHTRAQLRGNIASDYHQPYVTGIYSNIIVHKWLNSRMGCWWLANGFSKSKDQCRSLALNRTGCPHLLELVNKILDSRLRSGSGCSRWYPR